MDPANARSVVILDDDGDVAALVEAVVETRPGYRVRLAVGQPEAAVELVEQSAPDVVVVGAHRGTFDAVALVGRLRAVVPGARIVVLLDIPDPVTLLDALGQGADAVLNSASAWSELMATLDVLLAERATAVELDGAGAVAVAGATVG